MASLISDDQSSAISTDASNTTELSSLFRMSGENPQNPDGTHEDTTDDVDDAYKGINRSKLEGYTMAPHSKRVASVYIPVGNGSLGLQGHNPDLLSCVALSGP
jgi:hypothetical protein